MSLTHDITPAWYQNHGPVRHNHATTLLASTLLYKGAVSMQVGGKAQKVVSGTPMAALCLLAAGADANGGLYFSARRSNVRVKVTSAAAEKIVIAKGATIDIDIQYNNGTSTAATVIQLIAAHGEAPQLLRFKAQGTGATSPAALAFTAVPYISLLGVADRRLDNADSVSDATMSASQGVFGVGAFRMTSADGPTLPTMVALADESACKLTVDPLDILAPCVHIAGSAYYVDLAAAF